MQSVYSTAPVDWAENIYKAFCMAWDRKIRAKFTAQWSARLAILLLYYGGEELKYIQSLDKSGTRR